MVVNISKEVGELGNNHHHKRDINHPVISLTGTAESNYKKWKYIIFIFEDFCNTP